MPIKVPEPRIRPIYIKLSRPMRTLSISSKSLPPGRSSGISTFTAKIKTSVNLTFPPEQSSLGAYYRGASQKFLLTGVSIGPIVLAPTMIFSEARGAATLIFVGVFG